jgi:CspA family cold shock protein
MFHGTVKSLVPEKGFGFLRPAEGSGDIFFHQSAVANRGFAELVVNQAVEFELSPERSKEQGPKASFVQPGAKPPPPERDNLRMLQRHPRALARKPKWRQ